ncbi:MAG TPA: YIP1 family protein [Dehalococcoidia bacterium]|nr:YIP1 family protein [Dehalococcoidia bacterium]
MASGKLFPRMWRAARVESQLYEEVEADSRSSGQALLAVALVSVASGIGAGISALMKGEASFLGFITGLFSGIIGALVIWFIFSLLCFWLGTSIFKGPNTKATLGELLRTLGFAYSPGLLNIFSFIPVIGAIIPFVTLIWTVIAAVVAVRQACDFTTGRAIGTVIVAAIIPLIIMVLLGLLIAGAFAALLKGV